MAERMYRTQILLAPEQHQELAAIARREGRSISDLVREMIREQLEQRKQVANADVKRQLGALERIRRRRDEILARRGGKPLEIDVVETIQQLHEEQDERNLTGLNNPRD